MAWFTWLVARLSLLGPVFDPGSVYVRCVVDRLPLGQVFCKVFQLSLSVSFQQSSLSIFVLILLLSVLMVKPCKPSNICFLDIR